MGVFRDGHSARMRRTSPSTASAAPQSTPTRMQSSVRRPIACVGGSNSVAGSFAVLRTNSSDAVRRPGMITPPMKRAPPATVMQSNVVAVPKSTTMVSFLKSCAAASVLTMRSAPTVSGSSTSSTIGSFDRASTSSGWRVVAASMPSHRLCVIVGATDATTAARISCVECPACVRCAVNTAAHSSGVRCGVECSRQCAARRSPANNPTVVSVLPMSKARSMGRLR